ncbi:hypothetical protein Tco_0314666 [Tanacetum coccineum]
MISVYDVSADVDTMYSLKSDNGLEFVKVLDTMYSLKSDNGLEFVKVLDTMYSSRMIRRIGVRISGLLGSLCLCSKTRHFLHLLPNAR